MLRTIVLISTLIFKFRLPYKPSCFKRNAFDVGTACMLYKVQNDVVLMHQLCCDLCTLSLFSERN